MKSRFYGIAAIAAVSALLAGCSNTSEPVEAAPPAEEATPAEQPAESTAPAITDAPFEHFSSNTATGQIEAEGLNGLRDCELQVDALPYDGEIAELGLPDEGSEWILAMVSAGCDVPDAAMLTSIEFSGVDVIPSAELDEQYAGGGHEVFIFQSPLENLDEVTVSASIETGTSTAPLDLSVTLAP